MVNLIRQMDFSTILNEIYEELKCEQREIDQRLLQSSLNYVYMVYSDVSL